jgi:hypothetical protein
VTNVSSPLSAEADTRTGCETGCLSAATGDAEAWKRPREERHELD